ncbi:MAG: hypothetical protein KAS94_13270, partial [Desulfobulbaceae bacterium]|nr:hypothetical protein [Desulfobulbaceae bacterium]
KLMMFTDMFNIVNLATAVLPPASRRSVHANQVIIRGAAHYGDRATDIRGLITARQSFVVELPLSECWSSDSISLYKSYPSVKTRILQTVATPLAMTWFPFMSYLYIIFSFKLIH